MAREPQQRLLDEFDRAADTIAEAGVNPASWARLRYEVVDLIARGNRALTNGGTRNDVDWSAIRWDETDAPVVLARAFSIVHRRLTDRPRRADGAPRSGPPRAPRPGDVDEPLVVNFARLVHITHIAALAG